MKTLDATVREPHVDVGAFGVVVSKQDRYTFAGFDVDAWLAIAVV